MADEKKLFLLDAFALIYRAYFAFAKNPRINSKGLDTSAIFGFTNSLVEVINKQKPTHLAVVFDTPKKTQRHVDFPEYKAQREAMPEGISNALPYIDKLLEAFNIPKIYKDGFEADDVIGTLAKKAEQKGYKVYMMTSDKDFAQLVSENIFMYRPGNKWQPTQTWGIAEVLEKFNIKKVSQVIDFLAMMGDASDNIPGISGVGKKTAQKFIAEFGSIEGLFANTEKIKGKIQEKVIASKDIGMLSKKLVTIITNVPIDFDDEKMKVNLKDREKIEEIFKDLEFRNVSSRLFNNEINTSNEKETINEKATNSEKLVSAQLDFFSQHESKLSTTTKEKINSANHKICQSADEFKNFLKKNLENKKLSFHTVVSSLLLESKIIGVSFIYDTSQALYIPLNDQARLQYLKIIKTLLEDTSVLKIGYNLKKQMKDWLSVGIELKGQFFDLAIAHYILHPDLRHDLELISESYLSITLENDAILNKKPKLDISSFSLELISQWSNKHADIIFQLSYALEKELEKDKSINLFQNIEMPLLKVLCQMEIEGINLDVQLLKRYSIELNDLLKKKSAKIFNISGSNFNISSPKQLGEVLFEKMNLVKKPKKTKSGQYSTSEETLLKLKGEHEIIDHILDFREIKKLLSTYVDALPEIINIKTGRIHTTFNQSVASTGRLSSARPNLQNIPIRTERGMKIREAFVAKKGFSLLAADYSQIELRIMASLSKDSSMLEAFNNNLDIHSATAAKVYNVDLKDVDRSMRSAAKAVNFGIIYGISAFGLSQNIGVSRTEAKQIIEQYFEEFPLVKKYMDLSIQIARDNEFVETLFGRRRYLKDINSRNAVMRAAAERNAINAPIQGTAADIIKIAMIDIANTLIKEGLKSKMILQIHDELIFEMHPSEELKLKSIVESCMIKASTLDVPIVVDMGIGNNWLEAH
ncbi:DNA polymerase I [bacterium]|nr:DNA polymerase I [bacterium]